MTSQTANTKCISFEPVVRRSAWPHYHGADVEQPFDCVIQNRQAMQSVGRSMDWTLEDDMVVGLFCVTPTGRREDHTPFVQAGAETSGTSTEAVKPDPGSSWEGHFGVGAGVEYANDHHMSLTLRD